MKSFVSKLVLIIYSLACLLPVRGDSVTCTSRNNQYFLKRIACPDECPSITPSNSNSKAHASSTATLRCANPYAGVRTFDKKPNCEGTGAACLDPRFIGGDGVVFYFHGKRDEHFALVSDRNLQFNARFIGLRPEGRTRDFTWIQAIGILFDKDTIFSVEATKAEQWDPSIDHLKFSIDGQELIIPARYPFDWESSDGGRAKIRVERMSEANSALIILPEAAEISINVVLITEEDDRIHNYRIPSNDRFAHLEVQFRFYGLSDRVEGVLGRTYRPDFVNPAKPGVAMPVVGGEDRYKTSSLLDADCKNCMFAPYEDGNEAVFAAESVESMIDCTGKWNGGNGIVCKE